MRMLSWTVCLLLVGVPLARADDKRDPAVLDEARVLDQEGVRAYKEGRFKDAIVYFEQALKLGGPSSELWNVAKCHLKLDEPEAAHDVLDAYLQHEDLTLEDREEANATRDMLDHRTSPLTVTSTPTGARVFVDDKTAGAAPITLDVAPGAHQVRVEQDGYPSYVGAANARFGRAIVIAADLTAGHVVTEPTRGRRGRVSIEGGVGMTLPHYASAGGSVMPMGYLLATYALLDAERWMLGAGLRFGMSGDAWGTSAGVSNVALDPKCKVPAEYTAATLLVHAVGTAAMRVTPLLRASLDVGIGLAASTASDVGGDVLFARCGASTGVQPAAHFALAASYRVAEPLRLIVRPLILDLQPAYDGARPDASSVWLRYGFTVGAALDF